MHRENIRVANCAVLAGTSCKLVCYLLPQLSHKPTVDSCKYSRLHSTDSRLAKMPVAHVPYTPPVIQSPPPLHESVVNSANVQQKVFMEKLNLLGNTLVAFNFFVCF